MRRLLPARALAALVLLLSACAPQIRETAPETSPAPDNFPSRDYAQGAAQGKTIYRIDAVRSLVAITVRRGGSLARLGHDHVVASHAVQGFIAPDEGRADLYLPLEQLSVDEPALRTEAGLDTQPSASDIAGTRSNMLDKVLQTQQFPFALIQVRGIDKLPIGQISQRLDVAISLHGVRRSFDVPVRMETGPGEMLVSGEFEFNQSDFGIAPFSILGGAIQVLDRLHLRFSMRASEQHRPAGPPWPAH